MINQEAGNVHIKIFENENEEMLEDMVDDWLGRWPKVQVYDIKFQFFVFNDTKLYSVMIVLGTPEYD